MSKFCANTELPFIKVKLSDTHTIFFDIGVIDVINVLLGTKMAHPSICDKYFSVDVLFIFLNNRLENISFVCGEPLLAI